jgi:hypothetical protein
MFAPSPHILRCPMRNSVDRVKCCYTVIFIKDVFIRLEVGWSQDGRIMPRKGRRKDATERGARISMIMVIL